MPARPTARPRTPRPRTSPRTPPAPPAGDTRPHPTADSVGDVVRWAAFSCLLVPVVLVVYGTSFGGAAAAALGLAAVTTACRVLLRYSERNAARARAAGPGAGAAGATGGKEGTPTMEHAPGTGRGRRGRPVAGPHRRVPQGGEPTPGD
ncbi:hypothetical protein ACWF94_32375 [Streptomyces sp. NPDC055078]